MEKVSTRLPYNPPPVRPDQLPEATVRWIVSLPTPCWPLHLFIHYPKIGNKLATLWRDRPAAKKYFDELLMDNRGTRDGFPQEVFNDLMRLQYLLNEQDMPQGKPKGRPYPSNNIKP